ncbi:MAG: PEP-CTERM sorting domain-containing protein, partial [Planctomycetota bacterium]|nr:PEP-CTERM sorting domain-containing protein [Planctomycetota bacterium]
ASDDQEMALIWNGGYLKVGGSIVGYDEGAWQKTMDMAISTGSVHVQLILDMNAQTGTFSYDQYDADPANSGSVALDAITEADISFDRIWLTLRTVEETMGDDNITVDYQPPTPGDFNTDGAVDVSDLGILATNYGTMSGMGWEDGDANGDEAVDVSDLGVLATNYGTGTATASAVPEPSIVILLLCGMASLAMRIRR